MGMHRSTFLFLTLSNRENDEFHFVLEVRSDPPNSQRPLPAQTAGVFCADDWRADQMGGFEIDSYDTSVCSNCRFSFSQSGNKAGRSR